MTEDEKSFVTEEISKAYKTGFIEGVNIVSDYVKKCSVELIATFERESSKGCGKSND